MQHLKKPLALALLLVLPVVALPALSASRGMSRPAPDPGLAAALKTVSTQRIRSNIESLVGFGTRSTLSAQDPASLAAGRGIGAAGEWIKAQFESYSKDCGGCLEVRTDSYTQEPMERIPAPTVITNVYAVLPGTDPEAERRIVLVTGHYDSRVTDVLDVTRDAPGANDDASGVAVSLECARVLSKLKFRATIIFLAVAGEEQSLHGSTHFAQMARAGGWKIDAVLNNDIVGGDRSPGQKPGIVRVFSEGVPQAASEEEVRRIVRLGGESDSASRELARHVSETARVYKPGLQPMLVFRLDRYRRGGDHRSFNQQGYAAVRFSEYQENFAHQHQNLRVENGVQYGDLLEFVDFDYVAKVARLNAATLGSLAAAPAAPARVKLSTETLDNDSLLTWEPVGGASAYEVLWRATTSPDWEHSQNVGSETRALMKVSKDNVIFGVRALDAAGHRSLPTVPAE